MDRLEALILERAIVAALALAAARPRLARGLARVLGRVGDHFCASSRTRMPLSRRLQPAGAGTAEDQLAPSRLALSRLALSRLAPTRLAPSRLAP